VTGGPTGRADQDDEEFGRQLRQRRQQKSLSLNQLSRRVNCSASFLSRVERGERQADEKLASLCDKELGADGALKILVPAARPRRRRKPADGDPQAHGRPAGLPVALPGPDEGTPYDVMLARGDALRAAGKMRAAHESYQAAFDLDGGPRAAAETVIRMSRRWSDPGQQDREAIARIRAALDSIAGDDSRDAALLRLRLQAHLAKKLSFAVSQDTAASQSALDEGTALAWQTMRDLPADAPDEVSCEVLVECRWALFDSAPATDLAAQSGQIDAIAVRMGSAHFQGEGLVALAIDQMRTGQVWAAQATIRRHRRHAELTGSGLAHWHQGVFDTLLDLWRGNFTAAEDRLFGQTRATVEASEAELEISADTLGQTYQGQSYWLLREQGRIADMLRMPMLGRMEGHEFAPIWRAGFTLAWCETDNWITAADQLAAFAEETDRFRKLPRNGWTVPTLVLFAEACSLLHAQPDYRALAADLAPAIDSRLHGHDGELALAGWPTVLIGAVARARGLLAFAVGDAGMALDLFAQSERLVRTSPPQMARLRADRARVLLTQAASHGAIPPEASRLLAESLTAAERLGMARLAADVRALRAD
jgi:transcriptional regulator with XRE-family HTH domain